MQINGKKNRQSGFTLIELLVTIAILGIVIAAVITFFIFNLNTYDKGEDLAAVQFDVRMASDYITDELRNVLAISISDNTLANSITLASLQTNHSLVTAVNFELITESSKYFVVYSVSGNSSDGENLYTVSSRVMLNNIIAATLETGTTIYYTK